MESDRFPADSQSMQQYLNTQIGKKVQVEFLIGTGTLAYRTGILSSVGTDHIIITGPSGLKTVADLFSIKFVNILD